MTVEMIVAFLGVVISIAASYVPGFNDWFNGLAATTKRLFMLGAGLLVIGGAFGLSCAGLMSYFVCSWAGALDAVKLFFAYVIANQATYLISPKLRRFE